MTSPREWLQQLETFDMKSYNKIKGYVPPRIKAHREPVKDPVQSTASQYVPRITRGCNIPEVLDLQRGARLYRKGYHAKRYSTLYRSYRQRTSKTPARVAWLEKEIAYHLLAFQTLAAN
jgi:hypothetical protein